MDIKKIANGEELTVEVSGRLDTVTAPTLEAELKTSLDGVTVLVFDFAGLDYISSAGLRVLLSTQKVMNKQGKMIIRNANDSIMEIFDVTGFVDLLTIE
ncbi:MAG: STAS domain-containing protein [Oscillospiraceae bacterium]|nr:STAS domain-containing protein [Oscillospiraceae bacterium]